MTIGDVERVLQWFSPDGTRRVRAEHIVVTVEMFAQFFGGQGGEDPNGLWAMLLTTKDTETVERIRYVYDLFCVFEPNENEKVRVLDALLHGETKEALESTIRYLRAVVDNMRRSERGAHQQERGVRGMYELVYACVNLRT